MISSANIVDGYFDASRNLYNGTLDDLEAIELAYLRMLEHGV
jgi:hypothetical protein